MITRDEYFPKIGRGHSRGIRRGRVKGAPPCCPVSEIKSHHVGRGKNLEEWEVLVGRRFFPLEPDGRGHKSKSRVWGR